MITERELRSRYGRCGARPGPAPAVACHTTEGTEFKGSAGKPPAGDVCVSSQPLPPGVARDDRRKAGAESFDAMSARIKAECDREARDEGRQLLSAERLRLLSSDWSTTASAHASAASEADTEVQRQAHLIGQRVCTQLASDFAKRYRAAVRDERLAAS